MIQPETATESPPQPPPSRRLAVRFSLTLVALAFLTLVNRALSAAVEEYARTREIPALAVAAYVAFAILAGGLFGLAAMLPNRITTLHWRRAAVLGALPLVLLTLNVLVFAWPSLLPEWVFDLDILLGLQTATACAVLLGVALSSVLSEN